MPNFEKNKYYIRKNLKSARVTDIYKDKEYAILQQMHTYVIKLPQ